MNNITSAKGHCSFVYIYATKEVSKTAKSKAKLALLHKNCLLINEYVWIWQTDKRNANRQNSH